MFFVQGLTANGKEVLVNPDQVLYVGPSSSWRKKSILMMAHSQRLLVDQDIKTVKQRFEDYLKHVEDSGNRDAPVTEELDSNTRHTH
jgi:hypothetical protein